jgi:predicted transglutaminase-like cysteine proteinase
VPALRDTHQAFALYALILPITLPEPYRSVFRAGLFTGWVAIWVPLVTVVIAASAELGFSRSVTPGLIARLESRFGKGARERLEGWQAYVRDSARPEATARAAGEDGLLRPVNRFFNRLPAVTDLAHWGMEDYWATPAESLASNGADCEDYAIAKYFTLKELGVPIARLRLIYVKTGRSGSAHMVLAYYAEPQGDPLILDNLDGSIRPASDRPDLIPVYSFNDEDLLFSSEGAPAVRVSATSNRKWRDVLEKLERELTY